jgi:hypothetical protein
MFVVFIDGAGITNKFPPIEIDVSNIMIKEKTQACVLHFYATVDAFDEEKSPKRWESKYPWSFEFEILYKKGDGNQVTY